ncbi:helix-turn-helix domain-containing protein [Lactobacillus johnsonii]|uniref:helix-turn-helix domain-containing protein n=1 Tax=Lactobacillus johnsonii TaxID=33959 RepID=UPI0028EF6FF7|nr:helix-turn-helix domain-containing protein [Lactobacillus johnsonii]MDT9605197.1 helix-turn-helix domain-containing protein [Lactobacillus johnsonii]
MKIGEVLKEYRLSQNKNQKNFINGIVSQPYYSKVEQGIHRITAEDLIKILNYNGIELEEFFRKFNYQDGFIHFPKKDFSRMMREAYYENDQEKIGEIKKLIEESNLSKKDKNDTFLIIEASLETMSKPNEQVNEELKRKMQKRLFEIEDFNETNVGIFCDFIELYNFDTGKIIGNKILNQYQNTNSIKMQIALLTIVANLMILAIKENREEEINIFLKKTEKIKMVPELTFYKLVILFLKNLIYYRNTFQIKYLKECLRLKRMISEIGMDSYAEELNNFLKENIK